MPTSFNYQQIRIVTNPAQADFQEPRVPERLQNDLHKLHGDALKGKTKVIELLKKMIRDYQKYPVYKNLLYTAYTQTGNYRAAEQVAEQTYRMHPEYIYAHANYAESLLRHPDQVERVLEVLHPSLNLKEAFPQRQSFHVGEFIVYERSVIMYLSQTGAREEAENRLKMLSGTGFADPAMANMLRSIIEKYSVSEPEFPALQIPELSALYFAGSFMTVEVMRDILRQPQEILVTDLIQVLDDLTTRSDYWLHDRFPEQVECTALHTIMLLAELEAESALPAILRFFRQPEDAIDHWFGDFITELLPEVMAQFATPAQYDRLYAFSTDKSIDAFTTNIGIMGIVHRAIRQAELREPATKWLESVIFSLMADAVSGGSNIHLDLAVSAIIDLKAKTLLPLVRQIFDKDLLDESIAENYEKFADRLNEGKDRFSIKRYSTLEKAYAFIHGLGFDEFMMPPPSQADNSWLRQIVQTVKKRPVNNAPLEVSEKVSANAPCPCGSGKKYKRCHGMDR